MSTKLEFKFIFTTKINHKHILIINYERLKIKVIPLPELYLSQFSDRYLIKSSPKSNKCETVQGHNCYSVILNIMLNKYFTLCNN